MKLTFPFSALFVMAIAIGCASFSTNVFRTEQTVANVSWAAYVGYTNALNSGALHISVDQSNEVRQARLKLGASLKSLDSWRSAYETNSAVKSQVQAALDAVISNGSNIVYLVHLLKQ